MSNKIRHFVIQFVRHVYIFAFDGISNLTCNTTRHKYNCFKSSYRFIRTTDFLNKCVYHLKTTEKPSHVPSSLSVQSVLVKEPLVSPTIIAVTPEPSAVMAVTPEYPHIPQSRKATFPAFHQTLKVVYNSVGLISKLADPPLISMRAVSRKHFTHRFPSG